MADLLDKIETVHDRHRARNAKHHEEDMKWHEQSMRHWRAWGSWFSWGSPVGLGLFFLALAGAAWILGQTFHW